jgi:hypothetical protein
MKTQAERLIDQALHGISEIDDTDFGESGAAKGYLQGSMKIARLVTDYVNQVESGKMKADLTVAKKLFGLMQQVNELVGLHAASQVKL